MYGIIALLMIKYKRDTKYHNNRILKLPRLTMIVGAALAKVIQMDIPTVLLPNSSNMRVIQ